VLDQSGFQFFMVGGDKNTYPAYHYPAIKIGVLGADGT
jgi:hypothetical protein